MNKQIEILEELATEFEKLAETPDPTPIDPKSLPGFLKLDGV